MIISVALYRDEAPSENPPPYIHTITGSEADAVVPAGRNTLSVRQSSEDPVIWTCMGAHDEG